jgi:hypothetical protein
MRYFDWIEHEAEIERREIDREKALRFKEGGAVELEARRKNQPEQEDNPSQ